MGSIYHPSVCFIARLREEPWECRKCRRVMAAGTRAERFVRASHVVSLSVAIFLRLLLSRRWEVLALNYLRLTVRFVRNRGSRGAANFRFRSSPLRVTRLLAPRDKAELAVLVNVKYDAPAGAFSQRRWGKSVKGNPWPYSILFEGGGFLNSFRSDGLSNRSRNIAISDSHLLLARSSALFLYISPRESCSMRPTGDN